MKNILGKDENLELFDKEGKLVYEFCNGYNYGHSWEYTYDSNGNMLTFKDSHGFWSEFTYDSNGNELTYKNSDGLSWERTYDSNGNELTYKNSDGLWTERTYDSNGKQLTYKNGITIGFNIPEYTMEQLVEKLGDFKIIKR